MKILLLGNGFDLYHKLPTKYENFLHTAEFLKNHYDSSIDTIGKVFGDSRLQECDKFIADSYKKYEAGYERIKLNAGEIGELIKLAKTNIWFSYLLKSFNKDLGWIDFEKEIYSVIRIFREFFSFNVKLFKPGLKPLTNEQSFVLNHFEFFHEEANFNTSISGRVCRPQKINDEYQIERPYGSGNYIIDKDKIVATLQTQLYELADMLKLYLNCFINKFVQEFKTSNILEKNNVFDHADSVFTLNYTEVFENMYDCDNIFHIHGDANENIVLGVNSDNSDELDDLNTDFISFKKYYQRVLYGTDSEYKKQIQHLRKYSNGVNGAEVYVIGHSLDITDEDIIKDVFGIASDISIFYHDKKVIGTYIKNLVSIYGQKEFDKLRCATNFKFIKL